MRATCALHSRCLGCCHWLLQGDEYELDDEDEEAPAAAKADDDEDVYADGLDDNFGAGTMQTAPAARVGEFSGSRTGLGAGQGGGGNEALLLAGCSRCAAIGARPAGGNRLALPTAPTICSPCSSAEEEDHDEGHDHDDHEGHDHGAAEEDDPYSDEL